MAGAGVLLFFVMVALIGLGLRSEAVIRECSGS